MSSITLPPTMPTHMGQEFLEILRDPEARELVPVPSEYVDQVKALAEADGYQHELVEDFPQMATVMFRFFKNEE